MRAFHKVAGGILAAQIVIWIVTGLLFNYKYRYEEAFEQLAPPRATSAASAPLASPAQALVRTGTTAARTVRLLHDHRGYVYLFETGSPEAPTWLLVDANENEPLQPLGEAEAQAAFQQALTASKHANRYGAVVATEATTAPSQLLGREAPAWRLTLDSGHEVTVNAVTAEISHTGRINTFVDWTYRLHYMQYTPWRSVNIALVLVFSALALALVASGITMIVQMRRSTSFGRPMFGNRGSRLRF